MQFSQPGATIFVPDGTPMPDALQRVTHLGIGAHQDDLEFMAFHGILECYHRTDLWFGGVTCTNGGGSSRTGHYAAYTDADMQAVRRREQTLAASIGHYGCMIQLDHPSSSVKSPDDTSLRSDLLAVLRSCRPQVVYTHNPADKHDTHIGVTIAAIEAMRELPAGERPAAVFGCEGWRNLDWLNDSEKVVHDLSGHDHLAAAINGVFDSQIAGGKRYDTAVIGRRRANATFLASHATDTADSVAFAMDLTPLVRDPSLDIIEFTTGAIERFAADVRERLSRRIGPGR